MGWLDDMLSNLGKGAENHEELLGAIPLIAGSALLARNGRLGAPIGAGLTALGGLMELHNQPPKAQAPVEFYNPKTQQIEYQNATPGQPLTPPSGFQPYDAWKIGQQQKKPAPPKTETRVQVGPGGKILGQREMPVGSPMPGPDWMTLPVASLQATEASRQSTEDLRKQAMQQSADERAAQRNLEVQLHNDRPPREPHLQALVDNTGKVTGILNLDTGATRPVSGASGYKTPPRAAHGKFQRVGNELDYLDTDASGNPTVKKIKDIPATVKDKNEYTNFVSGYVIKNPTAGGMQIDKAWEDFKNSAAVARASAIAKTKPAPVPKLNLRNVGGTLYHFGIDSKGNVTKTKVMDIPAKVANKSEYADFANGYLAKNPGANGMQVAKAYDDFKNNEAAGRVTTTGKARQALPAVPKPKQAWDASKASALVAKAYALADKQLAAPGGMFSFGKAAVVPPGVRYKQAMKNLQSWGALPNGWGPNGQSPMSPPITPAEGTIVHLH